MMIKKTELIKSQKFTLKFAKVKVKFDFDNSKLKFNLTFKK